MNKQKLIKLRCKAWEITEDEYYCNQCSDFSLEDIARAYRRGKNKGKAETALLSQHILDLQKDKGNLTDRVTELEAEVTRLKNENLDIINKYTRFAETDRRTIAELEAQIEKMKCCENCKHSNTTCECYTICTIGHYDDCKSNTVLDSLDKKDYWEN